MTHGNMGGEKPHTATTDTHLTETHPQTDTKTSEPPQ